MRKYKMPIKQGQDKNGPYYQYGHLKKYYYIANNKRSREGAKKKAIKQSAAVHISRGY
jgi:hypothetical protein